MDLSEVRNECVPGKWVPIFGFRSNSEDSPTIPLFHNEETAKKFIKRNLPKEWWHGGVELTDADIEWMKSKGWILKEMNFPHLVTNYKYGVEILEFSEQPNFRVSYGR
jgi:hypothetical protein